jgi:hypothetical protein
MQAMLGHDGGGTIGQRWLETGSALVGLGLAVAVTLIPLRLGTKSLEAMEF